MPSSKGTGAAIELRGVWKSFGGVPAVAGLDLTVPRGATYGLLGPNGAGKTTAIRMLLRILEPDTGELRLLGGPVSQGTLDRVGYLPEERGLYRRMRVRRLLTFLAELKGLPARVSAPRVEEWLERLQLADRGNARLLELSKGNQQKIQFISAVLHDPEIVILDEPFSGLDVINQQVMKEIVMDLKRRDRTIIFCTHMVGQAEKLCDHVCILARGRKVVDGPLAEIKRSHDDGTVALRLEDGSPAEVARVRALPVVEAIHGEGNELEVMLRSGQEPQRLLEALLGTGVGVRRFEVIEPSLERIFLERVGAGFAATDEDLRELAHV
jgi:ABC-2 type transport system ATP-binding protein